MLNMFRSSAPRFTAKEAIARKGEVTLIDVREAIGTPFGSKQKRDGQKTRPASIYALAG